MSLLAFLAQIPEPWVNAIASGGAFAVFTAILLFRDYRRDERDFQREERRDQKLDMLTQALNGLAEAQNRLTRALALEVLTRPNAVKRAQDEANDLSAGTSGEKK